MHPQSGHASVPAMRRNDIDVPVADSTEKLPLSPELPGRYGFSNLSLESAIEGEWFGFEGTFGQDGKALPIPDRYVPDEFREWGVAPCGFDVVTSSRVKEGVLYVKRTRALPSVGCEADAVVPEVSVSTFEGEGDVGFSDGCVSCGPVEFGKGPFFTICTERKQRVRLGFKADAQIGDVNVIFEKWSQEFCDGQVLPGCGGGDRFAEEASSNIEDLLGKWDYDIECVNTHNQNEIQQSSGTLHREKIEGHIVLLPRGLSVRLVEEGKDVLVESGWLHENTRTVVERQYEEGKLIRVSKRVERRRGV